jgi:hypothetical protein
VRVEEETDQTSHAARVCGHGRACGSIARAAAREEERAGKLAREAQDRARGAGDIEEEEEAQGARMVLRG